MSKPNKVPFDDYALLDGRLRQGLGFSGRFESDGDGGDVSSIVNPGINLEQLYKCSIDHGQVMKIPNLPPKPPTSQHS